MIAGADSIGDLDVLRCGGLSRLFGGVRAPSTLGTYSALAHLPSGKVTANAAWLTLAATAYNLTRAAGYLASVFHARARTGTFRRHLINIPARIATGARRVTLHLPQHRCWADEFIYLWTATGQVHGHLTRATALPAHDPKDLGDPAPDGLPAITTARIPKKHPEPARGP